MCERGSYDGRLPGPDREANRLHSVKFAFVIGRWGESKRKEKKQEVSEVDCEGMASKR